MSEKSNLLKITAAYAVLAFIALYFAWDLHTNSADSFTFSKAELSINGDRISEKLYYSPDQDYHTLYRNFASNIYNTGTALGNSIFIDGVSCQKGTPYSYADSFCDYSLGKASCDMQPILYTERGEYGCTGGNNYIFDTMSSYWISAEYALHPDRLFEYNGSYYIKFVAYSQGKHPLLNGDNFKVNGSGLLMSGSYPASSHAIILIKADRADYPAAATEKITDLESILAASQPFWQYLLGINSILIFLPLMLLWAVWHYFGREKSEPDTPSYLSNYPEKRKAWEVAAYFNPPFNSSAKEFFTAMLLDLKLMGVIDVKTITAKGLLGESKSMGIKLTGKDVPLRKQEAAFMDLFRYLESNKDSNGYFDVNKAISDKKWDLAILSENSLQKKSLALQKSVADNSKEYFDKKGSTIYVVFAMIAIFTMNMFIQDILLIAFMFIALIALLIYASQSSLLMKFKGDLYGEFLRWQSFKSFLSGSQLKAHPPEGAVMWEEYLAYAAAFGLADKVLALMKETNALSGKDLESYSTIVLIGPSFHNSLAQSTGSSGGMGGGAGGGVGGGGGGGR